MLRGERSVTVAGSAPSDHPLRAAPAGGAPQGGAPQGANAASGDALFERLRTLRKQLADAQGLPPYVIFHDATLREMAARRPQTLGQFAGIRGVGEGKLKRYGQQFMAALQGDDPGTLTA